MKRSKRRRLTRLKAVTKEATPKAQLLIEEYGLDISEIPTNRNGKVGKPEVKKYLDSRQSKCD